MHEVYDIMKMQPPDGQNAKGVECLRDVSIMKQLRCYQVHADAYLSHIAIFLLFR